MFIDIDFDPPDAEKWTYTEAETDGTEEKEAMEADARYKAGQQSSLIKQRIDHRIVENLLAGLHGQLDGKHVDLEDEDLRLEGLCDVLYE